MILEKKDVVNFSVNVTEDDSSEFTTLMVSGLAFHSSLVVGKIEEVRSSESSVRILIHLSPPKADRSGRFNYVFKIPAEVNEVFFGNENSKVWQR